MLRRAAERPAGRLSDVFTSSAERQAAYDFIESDVRPEVLTNAFAEASLRTVGETKSVYVVLDGTSLSLVDRGKAKGFGSIGQRGFPTRGLKVIDALAVAGNGTPIGLLDLEWWARQAKSARSRFVRRRAGETETIHWVNAVHRVAERMREHAPECTPHFVIDREGDNAEILRAVAKPGQSFTVRATQDRPVLLGNGRRRPLRAHLKKRRILGAHVVDVPAGPSRRARRAVLEVRVAEIELELPNHAEGRRTSFPVRVV